jgi:hypothetical protein
MPNAPALDAYRPCRCGVLVLHGQTRDGTSVVLDPAQMAYVIDWTAGNAAPLFLESRAHPAHVCAQQRAELTTHEGRTRHTPAQH